jgi:hypothetical protein
MRTRFVKQFDEGRQMSTADRLLSGFLELGEGPPVTKFGRRILYRRSGLAAWVRAREQQESVS